MDTNSEQYRSECEMRSVAAMPNEQRQAYYKQVLEKRGQAAANGLIASVNAYRRQQMGNSSRS